ncbi:MAG TPA: helix-turn-helix domain-containing protein, partial [Acidimicrobiales bacterium]|nr:helix-turn-helix domain-containing protein [Acidimicrobiales bacterium]
MPRNPDPLSTLSGLAEPLRRRIYLFVAETEELVGRDAVAAELGIARSVAAFHLDKLAEVGLVTVEYRRPPGRSGPGAGRPAKLYRRVGSEVSLSLPDRRYTTAASLLARAVEESANTGVPVVEALRAVAADHGKDIASRLAADSPIVPDELLDVLSGVLAEEGYEPSRHGDTVLLDNCPFATLADEHRDLVCGMNLALVGGLVGA